MNNANIHTYLFFSGRCDEALEFYKTAIGAEMVMLMRFNESPDPLPEGVIAPGFEDKVMHAEFAVGGSRIFASDGCGETASFSGFSLSLNVKTETEAIRYFSALSEGGEVTMPLEKTFWSPLFGMLTDRFGIGWMVNIDAK